VSRLFGTDGVRGVANKDLTAELALDLAVAAAHVLADLGEFQGHKPSAVVGTDSRASGDFLEAAIVAGLTSAGVDVLRLGIIPTPGVAFLTNHVGADLGVMISASHNPMPDNGIKFFSRGGVKLADSVENQIEERLAEVWQRPTGSDVGRAKFAFHLTDEYIKHVLSTIPSPITDLKIVVDCANGAASFIAPEIYRRAGIEVIEIHSDPDGTNINLNCGSTHLESLQQAVLEHKADLGIAHDGDADRVLAIDHLGEVVDGDHILAILAITMNARQTLSHQTVVTTLMANLGFKRAMAEHGIEVIQTAVGDRYVLEEMSASNFNLGGEQSGHVILSDYATTGDGALTALQLMWVISAGKRTLHDLAGIVTKYPQVLINVPNVDKSKVDSNSEVQAVVKSVEAELGDEGRVLLRASGTEPLIRVMVEAKTLDLAEAAAGQIATAVRVNLSLL
jgi:phosphoglucosamine mutase